MAFDGEAHERSWCCSGLVQNALLSSTPRKTFMPSARKECTVPRILSTPSFSIKRFVARLLLTVIMSSQSCATVRVCPSALYKPVDRSGLEGGPGRPVLSQIGRPIRRTACGGLWAVGRGAHNAPDWQYIAAQ